MYELTEKDKEEIKSGKSNPIGMLLSRMSTDPAHEHVSAQVAEQLKQIKKTAHTEAYTQGHAAGVRNTEEWLRTRILGGHNFEIQERDGKPFILGLDIGTGKDITATAVISKRELLCIPLEEKKPKDKDLRIVYQVEQEGEVKYFQADNPEHAAAVIETLEKTETPVHYIGLEEYEYIALDSGKWDTWKSEEGLEITEYGLNGKGELVGKLDVEEEKVNYVDKTFREFVENIEPTTEVHLVDSHEELVFCANCHYQKIEHGLGGMAVSCPAFVPGQTVAQNKVGTSEKHKTEENRIAHPYPEKIDDSGSCGPFPEYAERPNNLQPYKEIAPNFSEQSCKHGMSSLWENTYGIKHPTDKPAEFDEAGFMKVGELGRILEIEDCDPELEMEFEEAVEKDNHTVISTELAFDITCLLCAIEDSHDVRKCDYLRGEECPVCDAYHIAKKKIQKLGIFGMEKEGVHFNYLLEVDHEVWSVMLCDIKEQDLMTSEDYNRALENPEFVTKRFHEVTCPKCRRIVHNASEIVNQAIENELFNEKGDAINMEGGK